MTLKDTGVNFFLTDKDLGKPRAAVVAPSLRELNPLCVISVGQELDEATVLKHHAVVVTQLLPLPELIALNELCRSNKISFFLAYNGGISTDVFVDHGAEHVVNDANGDRPLQKLVTDVKKLDDTTALVRYEAPEGQLPIALVNGHFEITEVDGIPGVNNQVFEVSREYSDPVKTVRIKFAVPAGHEYTGGGLLTEKKISMKHPMESLATKLKTPGDTFGDPPTLVSTDLINFGSEVQQHIAFYAVLQFFTEKKLLPTPNSNEDAEQVLSYAKKLLADGSVALEDFELDEKLVLRCVF